MSILQVSIQYQVFVILFVKIVLDRWIVYSKRNFSNSRITLHKNNISLCTQKIVWSNRREYMEDILKKIGLGNKLQFSALCKNSVISEKEMGLTSD